MFIAHLPAAYLALRALPATALNAAPFLLGSVLPDLDMAWFYLIDHGAQHHHGYLTHRPALWAALALCALRLRQTALLSLALGALLHLGLDSITGEIAWAWPLSNQSAPLVHVPATHDFWVWSFLIHWTFAIELAVVALAALSLSKPRNVKKAASCNPQRPCSG